MRRTQVRASAPHGIPRTPSGMIPEHCQESAQSPVPPERISKILCRPSLVRVGRRPLAQRCHAWATRRNTQNSRLPELSASGGCLEPRILRCQPGGIGCPEDSLEGVQVPSAQCAGSTTWWLLSDTLQGLSGWRPKPCTPSVTALGCQVVPQGSLGASCWERTWPTS